MSGHRKAQVTNLLHWWSLKWFLHQGSLQILRPDQFTSLSSKLEYISLLPGCLSGGPSEPTAPTVSSGNVETKCLSVVRCQAVPHFFGTTEVSKTRDHLHAVLTKYSLKLSATSTKCKNPKEIHSKELFCSDNLPEIRAFWLSKHW